MPSLFETSYRLPTSATALRRASNQTIIDRLLILAGTETLISFLFLSTSRPLPCGIGEVWRAALRPFVPTPVLVPPGYPGLPNRDADSLAPPPSTCVAGA
jgi:hypothetical protein